MSLPNFGVPLSCGIEYSNKEGNKVNLKKNKVPATAKEKQQTKKQKSDSIIKIPCNQTMYFKRLSLNNIPNQPTYLLSSV